MNEIEVRSVLSQRTSTRLPAAAGFRLLRRDDRIVGAVDQRQCRIRRTLEAAKRLPARYASARASGMPQNSGVAAQQLPVPSAYCPDR